MSQPRAADSDPDHTSAPAPEADSNRKQRLERLKTRLPPKRERFTPVERLRRRAVTSEEPLIAGNHGVRSGNPNPTPRSSIFKLVCWNIEDGLDIDGTIAGLSEHPNLRHADAICLQEMEATGVERIATELRLNYLYLESSKDERTARGFGNALLSPHPLAGALATPLPYVAKAFGRPRAGVSATVEWPSAGLSRDQKQTEGEPTSVSVWSVHTEIPSLSLTRRVSQFTAVAAKAIAPNPSHLLVAGDFNTTTLTSVQALDDLYGLFGLQRVSAQTGPSLRRAGRLFHLDHIYSRGLTMIAAGIERDVIASDHWPLWVDVAPGSAQPDAT